MIRLLYLSHARQGIAKQEMRAILGSARRFNPLVGITGVLVHGGSLFVQLLEGPEEAVLRLYVKILDDPRHDECRIIHVSPASERLFSGCSMGLIERDPLEFQEITSLRAHRLEAVDAQVFSDTLRKFLRLLNAGD